MFTERGQAGSGLLGLERADSECSLRAWGGPLVPDLEGWFLVLGNSGRYLAYAPSLPQSYCPGEPSPIPRAAGLDRYMEVLREGFDCLPSSVQTEAPRIPVLGEQSVQARRDLPASSL